MIETPTQSHIILGTAGHIDHGKSTLVQALTGTNPDRLEEEKKRGITIQLGFAELKLSDHITIGIVDVPGHEKFVRQMIAGSSGIDIALLCIAADDGIMPQTKEHLAVLELLNIKHLIVAITKCDIVDAEWLSFITQEIASFLDNTPYKNAPLCPVSSISGQGLDELKSTILEMASTQKQEASSSRIQLPIDRVFTIKGAGTVITGTLWNGTININDELEVLPHYTRVRVRSIQVHGNNESQVGPGTRVALNLVQQKNQPLSPGDFISTPNAIHLSDHFDCWLTYLGKDASSSPLKTGTRVHVAHGTKEVIGRILLMNKQQSLPNRSSIFAQIRLDEPLPLTRDDHVIIRSYSPVYVIAGGVVVLSHPKRRTTLNEASERLLQELYSHDIASACLSYAQLHTTPFTSSAIARFIDSTPEEIYTLLMKLTEEGKLVKLCAHNQCDIHSEASSPAHLQSEELSEQMLAMTYFSLPQALNKALTNLENTLLRFHSEHKNQAGIPKAELKNKHFENFDEICFNALIEYATDQHKAINYEGVISHPKASLGIKQAESQAKKRLIELFESYQTTPPSLSEAMAQSGLDMNLAKRMLGVLIKDQKLTQVTKETVYATSQYQILVNCVVTFLEDHTSATASELKDAMGTSRKYAMPLLEYMDSQAITRRDGDLRFLA